MLQDNHTATELDQDSSSPTYSTVAPKPKPPSARAARAELKEAILCSSALDAVVSATGQLDQDLRLAATVFGVRSYQTLPRYRRQYILGYVHGANDVLARRAGRAVTIVPPHDPAVPVRIQSMQVTATWHRHPHGGGWVSSTAYVALTAYVGPSAVVHDQARVLDMARVYGGAQICEQAEVYGQAQVHGRAVIAGNTQMGGSARASGEALVVKGTYMTGQVRG